jgi:hypothetical protein
MEIVAALGLALSDLFDDGRRSRPDAVADRQRLVEQGLENWRQLELQRSGEELRARDVLRLAINCMVQAGELSEDAAWMLFEDTYRGYSELEYKFERLLHGEDTAQLWREARRGAA